MTQVEEVRNVQKESHIDRLRWIGVIPCFQPWLYPDMTDYQNKNSSMDYFTCHYPIILDI